MGGQKGMRETSREINGRGDRAKGDSPRAAEGERGIRGDKVESRACWMK